MNKREMQAKIDELTKRNDAVLAILVQAIDGPRLPNVRGRLIADAIALMGGKVHYGVWGWMSVRPTRDGDSTGGSGSGSEAGE